MVQFDFVVPTAVVIQVVLNAWNVVAPWQKSGVAKMWWHHGGCNTTTSPKKDVDTATLHHVGTTMWLADW
jgi:hypothetical protein